jgi:hypothetical protein
LEGQITIVIEATSHENNRETGARCLWTGMGTRDFLLRWSAAANAR